MKKILCLLLPALATALLLTACEVGSASDVVRSVNVNVSGVYRNSATDNNGNLVDPYNGVDYLNLRQNGDQLEAIDNGRVVYRGTIGYASDSSASFNLEGVSGVGKILISGSIEVTNNRGTMRATWIEPNRTRNVFGIADGPTIDNDGGTGTLSITPSSAILSTNSQTVVLSVSGGTAPYSWSMQEGGRGRLSSTSGTNVTYTRTTASAGLDNIVTSRDSQGASGSVTIQQP